MKPFKFNNLLITAFVALGIIVWVTVYVLTFKRRRTEAFNPSQTEKKVSGSPIAFDITPDGKSVVIALADGGGLVLINRASGRPIRNLAAEGFDPTDPAISPDGRYLAYAAASESGEKRHLFLWEWQTAAKPRQLTVFGNDDTQPSFSPNGKRIAFSRLVPYWQLKGPSIFTPCVINADSGNLTRPTQKTFPSLSRPCFSLDGGSLLFSGYEWEPDSSHDFNARLRVYSLSLNAPYPVKELGIPLEDKRKGNTLAAEPDISPDAKRVVVISDEREPSVYELYVSTIPPSHSVRLQSNVVSDYVISPRFTPNGRRVLFLAAPRNTPDAGTSRGEWQLWEGDANGAKDFRLIYPRPKASS